MSGAGEAAMLARRGFAVKGLPPDDLARMITGMGALDGQALYQALWVVGYSGDVAHRGMLERYLVDEARPELAAVALKMLSDELHLATEYVDFVRAALTGLSWDVAGDVQAEALVSAGRILHEQPDHPDFVARIASELTAEESSLKAHAARAASAALGLTSREQAYMPLEGSPMLVKQFVARFGHGSEHLAAG